MTSTRELETLRRKGETATQVAARKRERARLGKPLSGGGWTYKVTGMPGFVYVRIERGAVLTLTIAQNNTSTGVGLLPDLPIKLRKGEAGEWIVDGPIEEELAAYTGGTGVGVGAPQHSHRKGLGYDDNVELRRLEGGLIGPTDPASLSVRVDPGAASYSNGVTFVYRGVEKRIPADTTIDLTAHVPSTAGRWRWVKVGYDPATATMVAVSGEEKSVYALLTLDELTAIGFDGVPLCGVKLRNGQTTIVYENDFADCRPLTLNSREDDYAYAENLVYAAAVPADWDSDADPPETVGGALDQLAATRAWARRRVEVSAAGSGAPNALLSAETDHVLTNEGASASNWHELPAAEAGLVFTFLVVDADGIRVDAAAGDTIRLLADTGTYVESTTVGDAITLVAASDSLWLAHPVTGAGWSVGS